MATGFATHQDMLAHQTGPEHPERPERWSAIMQALQARHLMPELTMLDVREAPRAAIEAVHDSAYVDRLIQACEQSEPYIDSHECPLSKDSLHSIFLAAGAGLAAVDAVMAGEVEQAFCMVRPPGHHAERSHAMGFCYLNNIAIAAQHLIDQHNLSRIAIIDFDVHHGNGTQHIFESRADVLVISIHQHPSTLYPGTGYSYERGKDEGLDTTLNIPLDPGADDRAFRHALVYQAMPALLRFEPEFLLLSAGFDAARDDPLAQLEWTPHVFRWATDFLKQQSLKLCQGRLVSILEGGYDLRSLAESVTLHVEALCHDDHGDSMMSLKAGM